MDVSFCVCPILMIFLFFFLLKYEIEYELIATAQTLITINRVFNGINLNVVVAIIILFFSKLNETITSFRRKHEI